MYCRRFLESLIGQLLQTQQQMITTTASNDGEKPEDAASKFFDILRTADKGGADLERRLRGLATIHAFATIHASSWTEGLAKLILHGVETLVSHRETLGQVAREAVDKSTELALKVWGFAEAHPVFVTVVAFGVLVIVAPWILEALGFVRLGPIAWSFASWSQARYAGCVPRDSLFSFLQRLGMTWGDRASWMEWVKLAAIIAGEVPGSGFPSTYRIAGAEHN